MDGALFIVGVYEPEIRVSGCFVAPPAIIGKKGIKNSWTHRGIMVRLKLLLAKSPFVVENWRVFYIMSGQINHLTNLIPKKNSITVS